MEQARDAIEAGTFEEFRRRFDSGYKPPGEAG